MSENSEKCPKHVPRAQGDKSNMLVFGIFFAWLEWLIINTGNQLVISETNSASLPEMSAKKIT